ncbi:MAG: LD-carboxypeptidase [Sutterella wadsworthensis]
MLLIRSMRFTMRCRRRACGIPRPADCYSGAPTISDENGEIDHARREAALGNLEALGAVPTLMVGALTQDGRYAGPDEVRAADFQAALTRDPAEADLVMPIRGGYGMTRLLPLLDWEAIGRAAVPMVGFSDFTAFNLALLAKTGRASWHGPMLGSFDNPDPYMVERFAVVFGAELDPIEWEADPHLLGKWADQTEQRAAGLSGAATFA